MGHVRRSDVWTSCVRTHDGCRMGDGVREIGRERWRIERTTGPCTAYALAYQIKYQVSVKRVGSQQGRLVLSPDEP